MDVARAVSLGGTITIQGNVEYEGLRSCAANCIAGPTEFYFAQHNLISYIGCSFPYYDNCYCNSAIVPQASSWVNSCVSAACSEVADVPAAFSAWEDYCSSAGHPVNNIAQTTADSGAATTPATVPATVPTTTAPTAAATTSKGSGPSTASTAAAASTASAGSSSPGASTASAGSSSPGSSTPASSTASTQSNVGAIAGGVVGGVVVIAIAAIIITVLILRDRRKRREQQQQLQQPQTPQGWQPPPASLAPPPVATEKIPKTPATTSVAPIWRPEESVQHGLELDGRDRMAPELEGWSSNRPSGNVPEMLA